MVLVNSERAAVTAPAAAADATNLRLEQLLMSLLLLWDELGSIGVASSVSGPATALDGSGRGVNV